MMLASIYCSHTRRAPVHLSGPQAGRRRACCETLEDRRLLSFAPAVNYGTVGTPSAIVTADFNKDGNLDLATCANAVTGSVSVFLGNGAGGFGAVQRTVFGSHLTAMGVGDFNNDTKPDILVSDPYNGASALIGNGDGTFQPVVPLNLIGGAGKDVVALGRSSHGSTEILVTWMGPDWQTKVQVYAGNLQGGFTAGQDAHYWGNGGMAPADLNNDGNLDVVTGDGVVFLGDINQSLYFDHSQSYPLTGGAVAIGDFTGDGKADAIVAGYNHVSVLRGRGDGTFHAPITYPAADGTLHTGVATADFNGDGKLDAVVSIENSGTARLMLGNGDGTLRDAGTFATGMSPTGVVVGDFNRDGRPDVAVSNAVSRTVSVLLNDGVWAGNKTFVGPGGAGSGGSWSTASNWSPSGVPGAGDVVTISGKSVTLGASTIVGGLNLTGGATLTLAVNGGRTLRTTSLSISSNSKLNLADNDLLIDYTGASPYATIRNYVITGRSTGTGGIVTTSTGDTALAVADNALLGRTSWNGETIDATTVIGKYTFFGDGNLDGKVTGDDYVSIDSNLGRTNAQWFHGDFNFSGTVTGDDYVVVDANLGKGTKSSLSYEQDQAEMIALHAEQYGGTSYVKAVEAAAGVKYKPQGRKVSR